VLQSLSESGITSRSFTVDSIVDIIGGHSSPWNNWQSFLFSQNSSIMHKVCVWHTANVPQCLRLQSQLKLLVLVFFQATVASLSGSVNPDSAQFSPILSSKGRDYNHVPPNTRNTRSSSVPRLCVPFRRKSFARWSFSTATPLTWNSLPPAVSNCDSLYFQIQI